MWMKEARWKEGKKSVLTIARLTFLEVLRKRVFFVTASLTVIFILLYGVALNFTAQEIVRMNAHQASGQMVQQIIGNQLLGAGLYFASFLIALLALLSSVGTISAEIENGLLHAIISKPIKRSAIIWGKFTGYGLMLACYSLLLYLAILALNWHYNPVIFSLTKISDLLLGAFLITLHPLVLLGVALLFSTLLKTLTAGIFAIILYGLGMVGGFLEQIGMVINNSNLINIGVLTSLFMPSDALFRKLVAVVSGNQSNPLATLSMGPFGVGAEPSNAMLVYTCFYVFNTLGLATYIFKKKDL